MAVAKITFTLKNWEKSCYVTFITFYHNSCVIIISYIL